MCAAFIEYYDEKWYDLSILNGKHLGKPNQCTNLQLNSMEDLSSIIKVGLSNRKTAKTNQNNHSSRSHALLVISSPRHTGQIVFVDMAGNECADGKENINETCFINKSISQLNKVLYFQVKTMPAPPYRDDQFTQFLQPYIQKNKAILYYFVRNNSISRDLLAIRDIVEVKNKK